jgi:hypothetical protein
MEHFSGQNVPILFGTLFWSNHAYCGFWGLGLLHPDSMCPREARRGRREKKWRLEPR